MLQKLKTLHNVKYSWSAVSYHYRRCQTSANEQARNKFEDDFLASHIKTTRFQKTLLAAGSAVVSLLDPMRADMIAVMGETAGESAMRYMLNKMENDEEGNEILR